MTMRAGGGFSDEAGTSLIDLEFQGTPEAVAAYLMKAGDARVLVECGPASTLGKLETGLARQGVAVEDLTHLVVTHIHLDHAGAAGLLVRRNPGLQVLVHPVGAPHLVDPARLVRSAGRIYGEAMDRLWGEVAPVPVENVVELADGARVHVGNRWLQAVWTAGHASHHVVVQDEMSGTLFTGDVGGVRIPGTSFATPPIPPPEVDPAAWRVSVDRMRALAPKRLALTHFGVVEDVDFHLDQLLPRLDDLVTIGRSAPDLTDTAAVTAALEAYQRTALGDEATREVLSSLALANPDYLGALGLQRLLRER